MIWGETMEYCFAHLKERVKDSAEQTDRESLFEALAGIRGNTLTAGVGGSSVVSAYLAKVLEWKNHLVCTDVFPRDLLYRDLSGYQNIAVCSYSGRNIGVDAAFDNSLNHYLFSGSIRESVHPLQYTVRDEEMSFVSFAGTLIPMALLLLYYTDNDTALLNRILDGEPDFETVPERDAAEILYGYENSVSARFLESALTEGGLCAAVMHEKYNYCHGRCKLNDAYHNDLIYFADSSELDEVFQRELPGFYPDVMTIGRKYEDDIINEFALTYECMFLCRKMAEKRGKDLSLKIIPEISEVLYTYCGKLK